MAKNRSIFTIAADIVLNRGKVEKDSKAVGKALEGIGKKGKKAGKDSAKGFGELQNLMPGVLKDFSSLGKTLTAGGVIAAVGALSFEIFKFAEGVNKARDQVKKFTKASGDELDKLAGAVGGLAKTYDKDLNEVLQATNTLSKQMGIGFDEALSLVEEGFIRGADASGELLQNVKEYPTFFKEAGFSAGQLINIINEQVEQGIFSDKGVDAVKEFLLRVREMPKATKDALKAIGIDGEKMQKQIAEGSLSIQDAFVIVSKALKQLPEDSQVVGQVLADVFGGAGEDAGVSFITSFADGFPELTDTARTEAQEIQAEFIKSGQNVATEWNKLFGSDAKVWTQIKTGFNTVLAGTIANIDKLFSLPLALYNQFSGDDSGALDLGYKPGQGEGNEYGDMIADLQGAGDAAKKANPELAESVRIMRDLGQALQGKGIEGQGGGVQGPGKSPIVQGVGGEQEGGSEGYAGEALLLADAFYGVSDAFGEMIAAFADGENGLEVFWQSFKRFALQMIAQMAAMAAMAFLLSVALSAITGGASAGVGGLFGGAGAGSFKNIFKSLGGFGSGIGSGGGFAGALGGAAGSIIPGTNPILGVPSASPNINVNGVIRGEDIYLSNQRYEANK